MWVEIYVSVADSTTVPLIGLELLESADRSDSFICRLRSILRNDDMRYSVRFHKLNENDTNNTHTHSQSIYLLISLLYYRLLPQKLNTSKQSHIAHRASLFSKITVCSHHLSKVFYWSAFAVLVIVIIIFIFATNAVTFRRKDPCTYFLNDAYLRI